MKKDQSLSDYVTLDLMGDVPGITSKNMFGGWGIYKDDVFFALIAEGELYFKVGDANRAQFENIGSKPFVYSREKHKPTTMAYWLIPEEIMKDRERFHALMKGSIEVANTSKKPKTKRTK